MEKITVNGKEFLVNEYSLVQYERANVAATAQVTHNFSDNDIDTIITTALEGGIDYWARLVRDSQWKDKPKPIATSEWATMLLLTGGYIQLKDCEGDDKDTWLLTLDKLMKGYALNVQKRPFDSRIEVGDATTMDCIIQYALFGEIVYG